MQDSLSHDIDMITWLAGKFYIYALSLILYYIYIGQVLYISAHQKPSLWQFLFGHLRVPRRTFAQENFFFQENLFLRRIFTQENCQPRFLSTPPTAFQRWVWEGCNEDFKPLLWNLSNKQKAAEIPVWVQPELVGEEISTFDLAHKRCGHRLFKNLCCKFCLILKAFLQHKIDTKRHFPFPQKTGN